MLRPSDEAMKKLKAKQFKAAIEAANKLADDANEAQIKSFLAKFGIKTGNNDIKSKKDLLDFLKDEENKVTPTQGMKGWQITLIVV